MAVSRLVSLLTLPVNFRVHCVRAKVTFARNCPKNSLKIKCSINDFYQNDCDIVDCSVNMFHDFFQFFKKYFKKVASGADRHLDGSANNSLHGGLNNTGTAIINIPREVYA